MAAPNPLSMSYFLAEKTEKMSYPLYFSRFFWKSFGCGRCFGGTCGFCFFSLSAGLYPRGGDFQTVVGCEDRAGDAVPTGLIRQCRDYVVVTEIYANVLLTSELCVELQNGHLVAIQRKISLENGFEVKPEVTIPLNCKPPASSRNP